MLIFAVIGYTMLVFIEFKPLYKRGLWLDFWVAAVLGIFSFSFAVLLCLNIKIPSPIKPIQNLIIAIFGG